MCVVLRSRVHRDVLLVLLSHVIDSLKRTSCVASVVSEGLGSYPSLPLNAISPVQGQYC